jgi:hypothetical protein
LALHGVDVLLIVVSYVHHLALVHVELHAPDVRGGCYLLHSRE